MIVESKEHQPIREASKLQGDWVTVTVNSYPLILSLSHTLFQCLTNTLIILSQSQTSTSHRLYNCSRRSDRREKVAASSSPLTANSRGKQRQRSTTRKTIIKFTLHPLVKYIWVSLWIFAHILSPPPSFSLHLSLYPHPRILPVTSVAWASLSHQEKPCDPLQLVYFLLSTSSSFFFFLHLLPLNWSFNRGRHFSLSPPSRKPVSTASVQETRREKERSASLHLKMSSHSINSSNKSVPMESRVN